MLLEAGDDGPLTELPDLPKDISPDVTAAYSRAVLSGKQAVPAPIALQVEHILRLMNASNPQETRA
jgi:DNA-binding NarL/FixJ family response regulator